MTKWLSMLGGFGIGFAVGGFILSKLREKEFDEVVDNIYNECYAQAREELYSEKKAAEPDKPSDSKSFRKIVEIYKPTIEEVMEKATTEEEVIDIPNAEEALNIVNGKDDEPYLVTEQEFREENLNYTKIDVFWYSVDNVFTDDNDTVLEEEDSIFDFDREVLEAKLRMGFDVYLRLPKLETDCEIHRMQMAYADIMYETVNERSKRLTKRKMKEEN